jgi:hypothetical protein
MKPLHRMFSKETFFEYDKQDPILSAQEEVHIQGSTAEECARVLYPVMNQITGRILRSLPLI